MSDDLNAYNIFDLREIALLLRRRRGGERGSGRQKK